MSLSQNQLKLITSLRQKKYRTKNNMFVAEGKKVVSEYLNSDFVLEKLFCVDSEDYGNNAKIVPITVADLKKISILKTPNNVLAIFKIPESKPIVEQGLILALDGINDPGNLGTIIRLSDWFNVSQLICSENTVDCYNPKVVQASMGSLARISVVYCDLVDFLTKCGLPKYSTMMAGDNVYSADLKSDAVLIMGNEANGIGDKVMKLTDTPLSIPQFGEKQVTESLNVATATAIFLSEFSRRA